MSFIIPHGFRETVLQGATHPGTQLKVMESAAGYYLGFETKDGEPYSRETDYFMEKSWAEDVLRSFRHA